MPPPPLRNCHPPPCPPCSGGTGAPPPPPPTLFLLCCTPAVCYMAHLHEMIIRLMIIAAGWGVPSFLSGGTCQRCPGPGCLPCSGVARGVVPGGGVRGGGRGRGAGADFFSMAAAALVLGRMRPHHCLLVAGSHNSGPALVGGMARPMPVCSGMYDRFVVVLRYG